MVVTQIPRVPASACVPQLCLAQCESLDVRRQVIRYFTLQRLRLLNVSPLFLKEGLIPWCINPSDYLISECDLFKILDFSHYGLQRFLKDGEPALSAAGRVRQGDLYALLACPDIYMHRGTGRVRPFEYSHTALVPYIDLVTVASIMCIDMVELLLQKGADVNVQGEHSNTCLHLARSRGRGKRAGILFFLRELDAGNAQASFF
ncbi:hypothetical protein PAXINDRAFT_14504 [Paxillus involutus ATCC 200175]|uniref:Uncharacterized protein n=1 Tax=Paxillus involutus ATCC 200175 TaxID=664439 RepID=A0A0C9TZN9_PAXIN|nr:hypothetical protein PAXINDRAFT_14504 [Paxillus involutus ATCC 200175]